MDGVQLIVSPDGTNLVREDFLRVTVRTLITQHGSNSQRFFQRNLVDAVLELNIVEIFDVHHIVTMQFGSDIYSLRVRGTPYQLVIAGDFLLVSFLITLSGQRIDIPNIYMRSTNPTVRDFLSLGHDSVNPSHIIGDKFGSAAGMRLNILREHGGDVSVAGLNKATDIGVLKTMLLAINFHSKLERTNVAGFSDLQNFTLSRVRENILLSLTLVVKHIMFHIFVSSFRIVIVIFRLPIFTESHPDHSQHHVLLLFVELLTNPVKDLADGFVVFRRFVVRFLVLGFAFIVRLLVFVFALIRVIEHDVFVVIDNQLILDGNAVIHNSVNVGSGICTRQNKAHLTDDTVNDIFPHLLQLICRDGQGNNVPVLNQLFSRLSGFRIVKRTVGINPIIPVFQQCVPQNIILGIMLMVPNQAYSLAVLLFKSILTDNSSVGAL